MSEDCKSLKLKLSEKLSEADAAIKEAEEEGLKLPPPVANDLRYAAFCYIEADKKLSNKDEEGALKELKNALEHVDRASFDMLKFRFLFYSETARSIVSELKEHESLAYKYITDYSEHYKNLFGVRRFEENAELPDEDSPEARTAYNDKIQKLRAFLNDFEEGKKDLFAAIDREENATKIKKIHVVVSILVIIGATILGGIIGWLVTSARAG